jgi:hypothetical protein
MSEHGLWSFLELSLIEGSTVYRALRVEPKERESFQPGPFPRHRGVVFI